MIFYISYSYMVCEDCSGFAGAVIVEADDLLEAVTKASEWAPDDAPSAMVVPVVNGTTVPRAAFNRLLEKGDVENYFGEVQEVKGEAA